MDVSLKAYKLVGDSSRILGSEDSNDSNGFTLSDSLLVARDAEFKAMNALLGYVNYHDLKDVVVHLLAINLKVYIDLDIELDPAGFKGSFMSMLTNDSEMK